MALPPGPIRSNLTRISRAASGPRFATSALGKNSHLDEKGSGDAEYVALSTARSVRGLGPMRPPLNVMVCWQLVELPQTSVTLNVRLTTRVGHFPDLLSW